MEKYRGRDTLSLGHGIEGWLRQKVEVKNIHAG
jgi:hypothetical protein